MAVYKKDNKPKKNPKLDRLETITKYNRWWDIYKLLPFIVSGLVLFLFFVWAILDITLFTSVWNPHYYEEAYHYGLFQLSSWVPVIGAWLGIGLVVATPFWFFTKAVVSAKVLEIELLCMNLTTAIEQEEKNAKLEEKINVIGEVLDCKEVKKSN